MASLLSTGIPNVGLTRVQVTGGILLFAILGTIRLLLLRHAQGKGASQHLLENAGISLYGPIDPLQDFDWATTKPTKYRPYKDKYHLTMSIESSTVSDLLEIDCNYLKRIMQRRQIMQEHSDVVIAACADASTKSAVDELYIFLVGTYLPTRYPRMFSLVPGRDNQKSLFNHVTSEYYSLSPDPQSVEATLQRLGGLVEDDLLFLLPSDDGDGYRLQAYVTCFPNGFNIRKKLNLKLRDIHTPVPSYKERLEKSMDRWFDRLEVGTFVKRCNWTVQQYENMFTVTGNHLYDGDKVVPVDVDIDQTFVRTERQAVHRLPNSQAILFSFKTYLYPIRDIKEEGLGPALAAAIDGLKGGNSPGMHYYKKAAVWGESVKRYLLDNEAI